MKDIYYIAGVDEAGRGPLFGPVYAAAVILDVDHPIAGLKDSKKLTEKKRNVLFEEIKNHALAYSIQSASVAEIDSLNILQASLLAMRRAILDLSISPQKVLIDGNKIPSELPSNLVAEAIVQGDAKYECISAASILAKVARDNHLMELAKKYPNYGLEQHKGYPTKAHISAIQKFGPIKGFHRESFRPVQLAMQEFSSI